VTDEHILFVTWDGPQVSYVESLFLPIFAGLQQNSIKFSILQFGWGESSRVEAACRRAGIAYRRVEIMRKFGAPGALASAVFGAFRVRRAIRDWNPTIIMPRSLFAGLAVLLGNYSCVFPMLFDADGLPADERVEAGIISPNSAAYRALILIERTMVQRSCHTIVRTEDAARILADRAGVDRARFTVVSNGRDPTLFKPADPDSRLQIRKSLGMGDDDIVLVYAGSAGPQYRLDEMAKLIASLRQHLPTTRLLVLSGQCDVARRAIGSKADEAIVRSVKPEDVPAYLSIADAALSLRSESLAMRAVSPVKIGEYLLCGLPLIGTLGIGNTRPAEKAGMMVSADRPPAEIAQWLQEKVRDRLNTVQLAREVGERNFSLDRSVDDYRGAIARLSASTSRGDCERSE
jgi:glycosyltransferase involved in cell wall biosynthesis